jgi:hypothetical protein
MPTQSESPVVVSGTSSKTLQLVRKRLRQLALVTLVLAICLAVAATGLAIWRLNSLNGLPDIADPFDVAAFRAFSIPEDRDAFVFFRRANEKRSFFPLGPQAEASCASVAWSEADPKVRAWVEANRPALELFRQGAGCADGISRKPGEPYSGRYSDDLGPRYLILMALLEGGRREEDGDMAGAWDCYRAVLHATVLSARRGCISERFFGTRHHTWLRARLGTWATDPRTTIPLLRRALQEALETRPKLEWHGFSLKVEYLDWMRQLEAMQHPDFYALEEENTYRLADMELPQDVVALLYRVRRFLLREPERSRRALRLLFANWLAHAAGPGGVDRNPAVFAIFQGGSITARPALYQVGLEVPGGARTLPPHEMATWLVTAYDLKVLAWRLISTSVPSTEQAGYRELVVGLATELYRREHGGLPPSEEALVGTYLPSVLDNGSPDRADEKTPTVD